MPERFLSSDDYDEHAHQLYNEGRFDEALDLLQDGIQIYPNSVELHVGMAYAYLAREDVAWARRSFERARSLDPDHEDTLAGYGEVLLKLGERAEALKAFDRILALGFKEDHELMLQIGRALFREGLVAAAQTFFEYAVNAQPDCPEAAACVGYACHRLNDDGGALYWLRRALQIDPQYSEARIYLANMLYDRSESEAAMHHLHQTVPEDHFDELGIWRYVELKKTLYRLPENDPELRPWFVRLGEVSGEPDAVDQLLAEVEALQPDGSSRDPNQLELFGTLLTELQAMQKRAIPVGMHTIANLNGKTFRGTWDEILDQMKSSDREWADAPVHEFMVDLARRGAAETGVVIPTTDAESFLRGSAQAGVVRIIQ
jgi:tetratricopeptide (TPR) repeat protein